MRLGPGMARVLLTVLTLLARASCRCPPGFYVASATLDGDISCAAAPPAGCEDPGPPACPPSLVLTWRLACAVGAVPEVDTDARGARCSPRNAGAALGM